MTAFARLCKHSLLQLRADTEKHLNIGVNTPVMVEEQEYENTEALKEQGLEKSKAIHCSSARETVDIGTICADVKSADDEVSRLEAAPILREQRPSERAGTRNTRAPWRW